MRSDYGDVDPCYFVRERGIKSRPFVEFISMNHAIIRILFLIRTSQNVTCVCLCVLNDLHSQVVFLKEYP